MLSREKMSSGYKFITSNQRNYLRKGLILLLNVCNGNIYNTKKVTEQTDGVSDNTIKVNGFYLRYFRIVPHCAGRRKVSV